MTHIHSWVWSIGISSTGMKTGVRCRICDALKLDEAEAEAQ